MTNTTAPERGKLKRLPVSDKADALRERLRRIPLAERLAQIPDRISKMCSQGRPPRMSIPVQWDDDDWFITYTVKDAAEALAQSVDNERALALKIAARVRADAGALEAAYNRGVDDAKEAIRSEVDSWKESRLSEAWDKSDAEFEL